MTLGDDIARKKMKIDKRSASNISRKLMGKLIFQVMESSSQVVGSSSQVITIAQGVTPDTSNCSIAAKNFAFFLHS